MLIYCYLLVHVICAVLSILITVKGVGCREPGPIFTSIVGGPFALVANFLVYLCIRKEQTNKRQPKNAGDLVDKYNDFLK